MNIPEFSKEDYETIIENSDFPVMILFYASWCETCNIQEKELLTVRNKWGCQVIIGKMDMDKNPLTAAKNMVLSVPTMVLTRNGKPLGKIEGYSSKEKTDAFLERILLGLVTA